MQKISEMKDHKSVTILCEYQKSKSQPIIDISPRLESYDNHLPKNTYLKLIKYKPLSQSIIPWRHAAIRKENKAVAKPVTLVVTT